MTAQSPRDVSSSPSPLSPCIQMLMVYEDLDTGNRAMRVLASLQHRCGKEMLFQTEMWKSDILGCPSMGRMAAEAAVETDVIIVSAHESAPLSDEVKAWFKTWIEHRGRHPAALVALLNNSCGTVPSPGETRGLLQQIAGEGRMDFFTIATEEEMTDLSGRREAHCDELPPPVLEWLCRKNAHVNAHCFAAMEADDHPVPLSYSSSPAITFASADR